MPEPTIVAKGTAFGSEGTGPTTFDVVLPNVTANAGDLMIVRIAARQNAAAAPAVDGGNIAWGAQTFSFDLEAVSQPDGLTCAIGSLVVGTGGTHDVVVPILKDSGPVCDAVIAVDTTNGGVSAVDATAGATGSGSSPDSGLTAGITRSNAVVLGLVAQTGTSPVGGAWTAPLLNGQAAESNAGGSGGIAFSCGHYFASEQLGQTFRGAKTGAASAPWGAICVAYLPKTRTALGLNEQALGTAVDQDILNGTLSIASATLQAGDVVVLGIAHATFGGVTGFQGATWNGNAFSLIGAAQTSGGLESRLMYLVAPTSGTANIVATWNAPTLPTTKAMWARRYRGLESPALDRNKEATGSSTSPSSGSSTVTQQMYELLVGHVATLGPSTDTAGTWSGSFTNGQRAGTTDVVSDNVTVSEGYRSVGVSAAYSAAKTGITSRPWAAHLATLRLVSVFVADASPVSLLATAPSATPALAATSEAVNMRALTALAAAALAASVESAVVGCAAPTDPGGGQSTVQLAPTQPQDTTTAGVDQTVRPTDPATLGDQDISTFGAFTSAPFAGGTRHTIRANVMSDATPSADPIQDVIFFTAARYRDVLGTGVIVIGSRMRWRVGAASDGADLNDLVPVVHPSDFSPPPGEPPLPPGVGITTLMTPPITTQPDGTPWTWQAINDLVDVDVEIDTDTGGGGHQPNVAEIWAEVYTAVTADVPAVIGAVVAPNGAPAMAITAVAVGLPTVASAAAPGLGVVGSPVALSLVVPDGHTPPAPTARPPREAFSPYFVYEFRRRTGIDLSCPRCHCAKPCRCSN